MAENTPSPRAQPGRLSLPWRRIGARFGKREGQADFRCQADIRCQADSSAITSQAIATSASVVSN